VLQGEHSTAVEKVRFQHILNDGNKVNVAIGLLLDLRILWLFT
jgi:hypothetical protein